MACALAQQPKVAPPIDPEVARQVRAVLDVSYATERRPAVDGYFGDLGSDDEAVRNHAGACLHALLLAVDEDSRSGRAPRFFGLEVCRLVAQELAEATWPDNGEPTFQAVLWLFRNAQFSDERTDAMRALVRIRTPTADAVIREIVLEVDPNYRILELAIATAATRGMKDLLPAIALLRGHYRRDVREAADAAALALGSTDAAPAVAPDQLSASLVKWLHLAAQLVAEEVPATAKWSKAILPTGSTLEGFLLEDGKDRPRSLVLPWGRVLNLDDEPGIKVETAALGDYVQELLQLRARYDQADIAEQRDIDDQLGRGGVSHVRRQVWHGSAAEILVAAWSFARGDAASAAKLLLPTLEKVPDEREWFESQLGEWAADLDAVMLSAFTMERDYPRALAIAQKLAQPDCAFWWHQDRAISLCEQLPRRMADFRELRLPLLADWPALKAKLSRREQVTFLIERLRLLNCRQNSTPGGISYHDDQYALPFSKLNSEKSLPKVVNPFTELLAMDLQPPELELLIPLLTTTDYVLAFDLERLRPRWPFSLHRLQWVAATLFENAAHEELIQPRLLQGCADEAQRHVDELHAWCKRWIGKSTPDWLMARLETERDPAQWRRTFWILYDLDPVRAADAAVQLAHREPDREKEMARLLVLLDRREHVGEARTWQSNADPELRFYGNVLVLASGADKDGVAMKELLTGMADADTQRVHVALPVLLASGSPQAKAFLLCCLEGRGPAGFKPTLAFAQRLMLAGYSAAFTLLDDALARSKEIRFYGRAEDQAPEDERGLLHSIGRWHDERTFLDDDKPELATKARSDLRTWLRSEWDAVQAGKPTSMKAEELSLPWGDLVQAGLPRNWSGAVPRVKWQSNEAAARQLRRGSSR